MQLRIFLTSSGYQDDGHRPPIGPPSSFAATITLLPAHQFPFGADCELNRRVQSAAFHYGLTKANADSLVELHLATPLNFLSCNPAGDEDQVNTYKLVLPYFPNPVQGNLVAQLIRRLCRVDPFVAIPQPEVCKAVPSGGSAKKKLKVSPVSGLVEDNVVASSSGVAAAVSAAVSDVDASKCAKVSVPETSGSSSDSGGGEGCEEGQVCQGRQSS